MCLGIPAKIVHIGEEARAEVEVGGVRKEAVLTLVPEAKVGDYILLHVGYAIQIVDEAEAERTLALLQEIAEMANNDEVS